MVVNLGRQIQFINGINGVSAGGNAVINMDVNKRYHRNLLQCTAVNYTGGTGLATVALTGAGNDDLTVTPTIVNGVVTAVAVVAGGTGYTTGDTVTIVDATGTGFVGTVTAAAGVVSAVAVTVGGTPSAINPATFFTSVKQIVNGINMRDIGAGSIIRVCQANGLNPRLGDLPLFYTEPWFNVNQLNEMLSWDLAGQSTYTLQLGISPNVVNPGLTGVMEFDSLRNARPTGGQMVPFLMPVAQHEYTFNCVAGLNKINTIPFDYPIRRMFILGDTPGNITQFEVYQDGNKVFEAVESQVFAEYEDYGFQFGKANYLNQTIGTNTTLQGQYNPVSYYDSAFIADPDQRIAKALTCESSLVLRVTSAVQQAITVLVESLPGNYAS